MRFGTILGFFRNDRNVLFIGKGESFTVLAERAILFVRVRIFLHCAGFPILIFDCVFVAIVACAGRFVNGSIRRGNCFVGFFFIVAS